MCHVRRTFKTDPVNPLVTRRGHLNCPTCQDWLRRLLVTIRPKQRSLFSPLPHIIYCMLLSSALKNDKGSPIFSFLSPLWVESLKAMRRLREEILLIELFISTVLCSHPATSRAKVSGSSNFSFSLGQDFQTKWEGFLFLLVPENALLLRWPLVSVPSVSTSSQALVLLLFFHFREVIVQFKVNRKWL